MWKRISLAYNEFLGREGLAKGKREIARRLYGEAESERSRDISRYMRKGGPIPRLPLAVRLAAAMEQPPDAFIDDPLIEIARELDDLRARLDQLPHAVAGAVGAALAQVEADRQVAEQQPQEETGT